MKAGWWVLVIVAAGWAVRAEAQQLPEAPASSASQAAATAETKGFFERWGAFYRDDWDGVAAKSAAAAPAVVRHRQRR